MTALVAAVLDGRVLARRIAERFELPEVAESERGPGPAADALAGAWGVPGARPLTPVLRPAADPEVTVHVVALSAVPDGASALGPDELERLRVPAGVSAALAEELAVLAGRAPWPARRPDWYRPGWAETVDAWVDAELARRGRRRTGASRAVKVWSLSAVLRVPATGGDVVVKAVCAHFAAEPAVTAWLHGLVPGRVPAVLAVDAGRGWTLMEAFPGGLGDDAPATAPDAARALAAVQVAAAGQTDGLRATGVPDRGLATTLAALADVVRDGSGLAALDADERAAVRALPGWLGVRVPALEATGLPPTLVHGDLHTGNYAVTGAGPLLFDWTDAALGHPVLDAVQLATSVAQAEPSLEVPTRQAWAEVWRAARPDAGVDAALRLAPPWFWAYQVVSYDGLVRAQEDRSRGEMAGVSAHALRRLLALRAQEDDGAPAA